MCLFAEHLFTFIDPLLIPRTLEVPTKEDHIFIRVDRIILHAAYIIKVFYILKS